jgi:tetratricopeptide (TPR) repeat protein
MYNLGLTEQRDGSPARAIGYFQRVLDSHPNDKEAGANIMEAYRNYSYYSAMAISGCYQQTGDYRRALHYTKLAKHRYPYQSWCGTCSDEARSAVDLRIAYLTTRIAAPYAASGFLVGGVFFVRSRGRRKKALQETRAIG